jgi:hypothetical protein
MGRGNVIDGLVLQLQQVNGFDAVSSGTALAYDHKVLGMGVDRAAVVLALEGQQQRMTMGENALTHSIEVGVFIRHNNDVAVARRDADTYTHNIIHQINHNPTLGGSVFDSLVTAYRVEDEKIIFNNVPFLYEVLTVTAEEHVSA